MKLPCAAKIRDVRDDINAALAVTVLVAALPGIVVKALVWEVANGLAWTVKRRIYIKGWGLLMRE